MKLLSEGSTERLHSPPELPSQPQVVTLQIEEPSSASDNENFLTPQPSGTAAPSHHPSPHVDRQQSRMGPQQDIPKPSGTERHSSMQNVVQTVIDANRQKKKQERMRQLRGLVQPKKMMRHIRPTRIPAVKRALKWCKEKWPGNDKYNYILHSPYFFLYVISMSLVQAFLSGLTAVETNAENDLDGGTSTESLVNIGFIVSCTFFALYIAEVLLRIYVKGFEFFLSIYNLAETSVTMTAFALDVQMAGTAFVANVLSLRVMWCIHKVPGITFLLEGIKLALPRISVVLFPLLILIYVFAVVATSTLGPSSYTYYSPNYWRARYAVRLTNGTRIIVNGANLPYDYYGNIAKSMFTLFQVMTGDGWADTIARPTMVERPWSFLLFITFYSLFSFVLLNIFTGIMVDAIQSFERMRTGEKKKAKPHSSSAQHLPAPQQSHHGQDLPKIRATASMDDKLSNVEPEKKIQATHFSTERDLNATQSADTIGPDTHPSQALIQQLLRELQGLRGEMMVWKENIQGRLEDVEQSLESEASTEG